MDRAGRARRWAGWLLLGGLAAAAWMGACGPDPEAGDQAQGDAVAEALEAGYAIDTVGVRNLTEGDTLNPDSGLTIIETTVTFQPTARQAEVIAWDFYAEALRPVKLVLFRYVRSEETFELVGESPTVIPRHLGVNRISLPEPIPVGRGSFYGIHQPEEGTIPFRRIRNWKTLITAEPYGRPFTPRTRFSMYGWRYAARVYYRYRPEEGVSAD
ncbi:hypothetical protein ACFL6X_07425 [Candidatus Latescibacterota bacterium]